MSTIKYIKNIYINYAFKISMVEYLPEDFRFSITNIAIFRYSTLINIRSKLILQIILVKCYNMDKIFKFGIKYKIKYDLFL